MFADRSEDPALRPRLESLAKNPSTALSHEDEVGVNWKVKRGWPSRHLRAFGTYSGINVEDADSLFDRKLSLDLVEKRMNS